MDPPASPRDAAAALLQLLSDSDWVNRRVETITLLDQDTIRRTMSLDFTLPAPLGGQAALTPILMVPKRAEMLRVDVRDAQTGALPLITRRESSRLAAGMVLVCAEQRLAHYGVSAPVSRPLAQRLARAAIRPGEAGGLSDARAALTGKAADGRDLYQELYPDPVVAAVLRHDDRFADVLAWMATCAPLIVSVATGGRQIVKIGFDEGLRRRANGRLSTVGVNLGVRSPRLSFPAPDLGNAEEYHLQICAPDGVAVLDVRAPGGRPNRVLAEETLDPPESTAPFPLRHEPSTAVKSTYRMFGNPPRDARSGVLAIRVQADPGNFAGGAAIVSAVTAVLLWAHVAQLDEVVGETEAAAAILLLVPAVGAAFVLRTEHPMVAALVSGTRALVVGVALLAVVAATALVTLPRSREGASTEIDPTPALDAVMTVTASLATAAALVAILVWLISRRRGVRARQAG